MVRGWKTVLKKFEGTPRSGTANTHSFCIFNGAKLDRVVRDKRLWNLNETVLQLFDKLSWAGVDQLQLQNTCDFLNIFN